MDWDDVRSRLRGPGALISTIFHDDYTLDLEALESNVRHIVDLGIGKKAGYLIAPCGDGEYVTLSAEEHRLVVETAVRFVDLTARDLDWYVSTGDAVGKAGGYGIQGAAGAFVERIDGSVTNVIGLPLAETLSMLAQALRRDPPAAAAAL